MAPGPQMCSLVKDRRRAAATAGALPIELSVHGSSPRDLRLEGRLEARNRLVEEHQPLVVRIARRALRYARSIGARAELDDLVGLAQEGLVRAAESFDPAKGVPFEPYAWLRAMGHIKDALRKDDYLTRRERQVVQAWLRGEQLDEPRSRQAARLASQRPKPVRTEVALELPGNSGVEDTVVSRVQADEALGFLKPIERAVLSYRYLDGFSFSAISTLLQVTESWVSQVHKAALRELRQSFEREAG